MSQPLGVGSSWGCGQRRRGDPCTARPPRTWAASFPHAALLAGTDSNYSPWACQRFLGQMLAVSLELLSSHTRPPLLLSLCLPCEVDWSLRLCLTAFFSFALLWLVLSVFVAGFLVKLATRSPPFKHSSRFSSRRSLLCLSNPTP